MLESRPPDSINPNGTSETNCLWIALSNRYFIFSEVVFKSSVCSLVSSFQYCSSLKPYLSKTPMYPGFNS